MDGEVEKSVILVTGMHRSGTSAVTRVLSLLGCALPRAVTESARDNEKGFWENPAIRDLNDRILVSAGSAWDDWEPFDSRWYASPIAGGFRDDARAILEGEFGDGRLFVVKDPRICRLLPFWTDAVRSFGAEPFIVSPVRNPLDVAASLEERDGIHPSIGLLMWLRHVLDTEAASRDLRRVYLRYEHLLFKTHAVVDRLGDALGVVWPTRSTRTNMEIEEFLSPTLRHHQNDDTGVVGNPRLSHWLRSSFEILDRWACGSVVRKKDFSALDRVRAAFDDAAPAFGSALAVGVKAARDLTAANDTLTERDGRIEILTAELDTTRETLAERDERIVTLASELDAARGTLLQRDAHIETLASEQAERDGRIEILAADLNTTRETLAEHDERIVTLTSELDVAHGTVAERDAHIETLASEQAERDGRIEILAADLNTTHETLAERDERIVTLTSELDAARGTLLQRDAHIETLASEQAERDGRIEILAADLNTTRETLAEHDERIVTLTSELDVAHGTVAERDAHIETLASEQAERDGRIEILAADLNTTRETLAEHDERIVTLTSELDVAHGTVAERDAHIETLASEQAERDGRIEILAADLNTTHETLAERDERIVTLTSELDAARGTLLQRDAHIETLASEQAERDGRIEILAADLNTTRETLAERDERIVTLTSELDAARETVAERDARLVTLTSELDTSRETLAERNARIEMAAAELGATREQLSGRDERIIQFDTELRQTRASTSWRLTRPVRYLGHHARRAARLLKITALVLRTPGSVKEVMRRVRAVRRQEGTTGIADRVRRVLSYDDRPAHAVLSIEDRRTEFASPSSESKPDIFIFSIIDWDFRIQRSQHLAKELAESGRRVFYVEMILEPDGLRITKIGENIYRVRFPSTNIGHMQPYVGNATEEQRLAWNETFNTFCDTIKATSFKQAIIQHPFWWQMLRSISPEFQLIHDCMDDISGFSNTDRFVLDLEEDMIANCDKLIVSSQTLFDKFKALNPSGIIRNAVDADHFSSEAARHSALFVQKLPSLEMRSSDSGDSTSEVINVGYVGAIAEWFDAALVKDAALNEPNLHFHLCGAVSDKNVTDLLQGMENVFLYGEIGYVDVPSFLGKMDVLIIPFKILPIIEACDPVKFYEYSIMGKPTVATRLPELSRSSDLVFFASTSEEFATQIQRAHERIRDPEFRGALKDYALRNTWRHRGNDLVQVLEDLPLVSVIILSYGDPGLSKASIHSLFEQGRTYPNMEVLVVDNGSPSASLDDIRSFASHYPNVHIVENGENLGFAKGNNVGLNRATGEYVVLLNNDTYVAPGAIHAMVRHLSSNPELGAIGPLTNNIGNEARIAVEYHDMEQMKKIARRITLGFRSRFFAVDVLGYFAVMFRRVDLEHFGFLPTDYGLGMFEDDDHCRTIHSIGFVTAVTEDAFVHHHLSASFNSMEVSRRKALFERNKATFERKWGPWRPHRYRKSRPARIL